MSRIENNRYLLEGSWGRGSSPNADLRNPSGTVIGFLNGSSESRTASWCAGICLQLRKAVPGILRALSILARADSPCLQGNLSAATDAADRRGECLSGQQ